MMSKVKQSATRAARKAGMVSAGALCILVGAGFLTGAAWIFLAAAYDTLIAASVIGAVYAGHRFAFGWTGRIRGAGTTSRART